MVSVSHVSLSGAPSMSQFRMNNPTAIERSTCNYLLESRNLTISRAPLQPGVFDDRRSLSMDLATLVICLFRAVFRRAIRKWMLSCPRTPGFVMLKG